MKTTQIITDLLNREPLTVNDLAVRLGISRNTAHQHVSKLHAQGILIQLPPKTPAGAGKPAHTYRTAPKQEDVHSVAYKPVLESLIQTLSKDLPAEARINVLTNTGRSLATAAGLPVKGNLRTSIQKSIDTVNSLGAMANLRKAGKKYEITCYSCPVATLVHNEPLTCHMVAAFFSEASGKNVSIKCRKDETVVCKFQIED